VANTKSSWDKDRFGFFNPRPPVFEEAIEHAKSIYDQMNPYDDDRSSTTSSKNSLVTRTQHMLLDEIAQHEKKLQLVCRPTTSPYTESLLADYHKHLLNYESDQDNGDDDCVEYIPEPKSSGTQDLETETDSSHALDVAKADVHDHVPSGHRQTRSKTRLASYNYPIPFIPGDDDGAGSLEDPKHNIARPGCGASPATADPCRLNRLAGGSQAQHCSRRRFCSRYVDPSDYENFEQEQQAFGERYAEIYETSHAAVRNVSFDQQQRGMFQERYPH
jgi:hypothetical protein